MGSSAEREHSMEAGFAPYMRTRERPPNWAAREAAGVRGPSLQIMTRRFRWIRRKRPIKSVTCSPKSWLVSE